MKRQAFEVVVKPEIKIRLVTSGGKAWAIAHLITVAGPVCLCAQVDVAKVMALLQKRQPAVETAGFFDDVGKLAKKVAKGQALKKVLDQVEEIRRNPMVARAVGVATVVVPGAGAAVAAYDAAHSTIKALEKKDPAAIAKVAKLRAFAEAGHPKAAKALRVLQIVRQHNMAAQAVTDPSQRNALVVAYSRELRATLPPTLLGMLRPALDRAAQAAQPKPGMAVAGWDEDDIGAGYDIAV